MQLSHISIGHVQIPMRWIASRNRRKTIALKVTSAWLHVSTPLRYNQILVDRFITSKHAWITKMREKAQRHWQERTYEQGEMLWYKGIQYPLSLVIWTARECGICFVNETIQCTLPARISDGPSRKKYIERCLNTRYKAQAEMYLIPRTRSIIQANDFSSSIHITVKAYKWVYGKCRAGKDIMFNYHIIKFPPSVIDHVIVHELCHTKYMWHGKDFWGLVYEIDPDAKAHRARLKEHGSIA